AEDIEGNLLAGRAGTTSARRRRHLLPMTFRAFLAATRPELARPPAVHPARLQHPDMAATLEALRFDVDAYDLAWQDCLTCGGFPRAVAEHHRTGAVTISYLRDLAAWLHRDVDPDAPAESVPLLLHGLAARACNPLNVTTAAADLGYANHKLLGRRLERLIASFAGLWCPPRQDAGGVVAGGQAKFYLTDPLLAWLPCALRAGLATPDMTTLNEMVLGVALARTIDQLDEGRLFAGDAIGFIRTSAGREVDLAPVPVPGAAGTEPTTPLESKWVDTGWRSEAKVIEGKYNAGVIATKSVLELTHPTWAVPAPLVALLLG
ncbi:MAG: hypothetical protein ACR2KC_03095, partial [Acidimicrobiales bacterium]